MRCPKCGYNSFDFNLICPKCRKDLTAARRLLNLTLPMPRPTDFFQTAGQRTAFPEPFLEATPDNLAPQAALQALEPLTAAPLSKAETTAQAGAATYQATGAPPYAGAYGGSAVPEIFPVVEEIEDIAPIDELEDISPIEDELEDIEPILLEDDVLEEIAPLMEANNLEDIVPVIEPSEADFAEEIEIEIDAFDTPPEEPPLAAAQEAGQHQAALDQIKSALAHTGDLPPATAGAPEEGLNEPVARPDLEPDDLSAPMASYALNLGQNQPKAPGEFQAEETLENVDLNRDLKFGELDLSPDQPPEVKAGADFLDELDEKPLAVLDTPLLDEADLILFPEGHEPPLEISLDGTEIDDFEQPLIPPAADATLSAQSQTPGSLDNSDDLDDLIDDINLDDLDDKL